MNTIKSIFITVTFASIFLLVFAGRPKSFAGYGDMYVSTNGVVYTRVATNPDQSNLTYSGLGAPSKVSNYQGTWYTLYFLNGGSYYFVYSQGW